jgi:hypothetical protein
MGFAFFGRKLQCQSASAPGGGDWERFLILLYKLWVFCLLLLQAVKMIVHGARKGVEGALQKRRSCGGSVFDKTTKEEAHLGGGGKEERWATHLCIIWHFLERKGGRRRVGSSFLSRMLSVSSLFSDLVDIFETSFSLLVLLVCVPSPLYVSYHA